MFSVQTDWFYMKLTMTFTSENVETSNDTDWYYFAMWNEKKESMEEEKKMTETKENELEQPSNNRHDHSR